MASPSARRGLAAAGALLLLVATGLLQDAAQRGRGRLSPEADLLYLPRASALRVMSLGHRELAADLVFIRAIIYFGAQMGGDKQYRWLENYLDTIVALDPAWKTPYRWAGVATMYNGRTITNESVTRSSHFLELGTRRFPSDWELPFMLGCNYLFELHTDDAEQRRRWRRQGAEWVRHAALVGGGPAWVPLLAATILKQEGLDEAALHHLEAVYLSTRDEQTRQEVRNRLLALHSRIDFLREARQRDEFERGWKRTLPYAPPELYTLIGPRPSPRLDLPTLAANPIVDLPPDPDDVPQQ
jgi:hypothetical protein